MGLQGSLHEIGVSQVIDLARARSTPVAIYLETPQGVWSLYVEKGRVVHIEGPNISGEAALPHLLTLQEGQFRLVEGEQAPQVTITRPWNQLLLEALKRLDEEAQIPSPEEEKIMTQSKPKKTREQMAEILETLLAESTDILGAAVVGVDGLIYTAHFPIRDTDDHLVAAITAAIYGLSQRSTQQLRHGDFIQTLVQGSEGYILIRQINPRTVFVALLPKEVNLGMAFAEARTAVARLSEILSKLM